VDFALGCRELEFTRPVRLHERKVVLKTPPIILEPASGKQLNENTKVLVELLSRRRSLRLLKIFECFTSTTSAQPLPTWQKGAIPFGLRGQEQLRLAPLTMKNFPLIVFHSAIKQKLSFFSTND
jgi:hypothetical protein